MAYARSASLYIGKKNGVAVGVNRHRHRTRLRDKHAVTERHGVFSPNSHSLHGFVYMLHIDAMLIVADRHILRSYTDCPACAAEVFSHIVHLLFALQTQIETLKRPPAHAPDSGGKAV